MSEETNAYAVFRGDAARLALGISARRPAAGPRPTPDDGITSDVLRARPPRKGVFFYSARFLERFYSARPTYVDGRGVGTTGAGVGRALGTLLGTPVGVAVGSEVGTLLGTPVGDDVVGADVPHAFS